MKKTLFLAIVLAISCGLLFSNVFAADTTKVEKKAGKTHSYVGAKKCKICHKDVHKSWALTSHANAWDKLKPAEQKDPKCIECHSTGITKKGVFLEGVQCEACHGPGSDYKKKKVMKDPKLAAANGLITPDKELCITCHNKKSPTFKGFDYDKYKANEKGMHKMEKTVKKAATKG